MRRSGLPRSEIFVTTKVADTMLDKRRFLPSVERSLETIGVDQVDLLLIHWPCQGESAVRGLHAGAGRGQGRGPARLIGVSNFSIADLERPRILGAGAPRHQPGENPPFCRRRSSATMRARRGLPLTAYEPLMRGKVHDEPTSRRSPRGTASGHRDGGAGVPHRRRPYCHPGLDKRTNLRANIAAAEPCGSSPVEIARMPPSTAAGVGRSGEIAALGRLSRTTWAQSPSTTCASPMAAFEMLHGVSSTSPMASS